MGVDNPNEGLLYSISTRRVSSRGLLIIYSLLPSSSWTDWTLLSFSDSSWL